MLSAVRRACRPRGSPWLSVWLCLSQHSSLCPEGSAAVELDGFDASCASSTMLPGGSKPCIQPGSPVTSAVRRSAGISGEATESSADLPMFEGCGTSGCWQLPWCSPQTGRRTVSSSPWQSEPDLSGSGSCWWHPIAGRRIPPWCSGRCGAPLSERGGPSLCIRRDVSGAVARSVPTSASTSPSRASTPGSSLSLPAAPSRDASSWLWLSGHGRLTPAPFACRRRRSLAFSSCCCPHPVG
mmetsp:Transcript_31064/g.66989  ORF Transcript_31064/g.66989 Transcript_31064/m.66989 type:complete len:240 (-) Transcript_31064:281-1000(-)